MGMYCVCGWKSTGDEVEDYKGCSCSWDGWVSCYDYPKYRGNSREPCRLPEEEGVYLVRIQAGSADKYEAYSRFSKASRKINCQYTGKELETHWSGDSEEDPYAWYDASRIKD